MISVVNGTLFARRMERRDRHGLARPAWATARPPPAHFHERLKPGCRGKTPVVLVLATTNTPIHANLATVCVCADLGTRPGFTAWSVHSVDGTDCSLLKTLGQAVGRARAGMARSWSSPKTAPALAPREHDDSHYIDPKLKSSR